MLKERILELAIKALSRAHDTRERIKKKLNSTAVKSYVREFRDTALWIIDNKIIKEKKSEKPNSYKNQKPIHHETKKNRKSSIRPAHEIQSEKADGIMSKLKKEELLKLKKNDTLNGKKSLAYLIWALGHAERARIGGGISVHDITSLLYKAQGISLYPINFSRVLHSNTDLIRQVGRDNKTKTYLLTPQGKNLFEEKFA